MASTLLQQETQIRASLVADRDDTVTPSEANFETNAVSLLDDINNISSQLSNLLDVQAGNWYDDLNTPSALDAGSQRGVNDLNTDLHGIERKRVLIGRKLLVDVTVGGSDNWVILGTGELPTAAAAVGAVTTEGTVIVTHGGTFGTNDLTEISGAHALAPKNLLEITDASGDPILSSGRRIWGLLQGESGLADGETITITTPERAQISFVRPNAGHTDLEACPAADIQGLTIRYCYTERIAFDDMVEQDWAARGAAIDIGAGAATVTRQVAYDNQGTTPVDVTTNSILDLEGAGLTWAVRDDLEAELFKVTEGSAGGTSEVSVEAGADTFRVDAIVNDFDNGASFDTGSAGTTIDIGVTVANQVTSGGNMVLKATSDLRFTDQYEPAGWSEDGIQLSDSAQTWTDFETEFGEVGLMDAIIQAKNTSGRRRVFSVATANVAADVDVSGPSNDNNLDADLGDLSAGTFVDDYDIYHNGQYLRLGANAGANFDVYPGTALASGQLKFERKLKTGDTLCVVDLAE